MSTRARGWTLSAAALASAAIAVGAVTVAATANEVPAAGGRNEWGQPAGVDGVDVDGAEVVGDTGGTDRMVLYGRDTRFTFVDDGPAGPSVGDTFLFKQAVHVHGGNRVGSLYVECVLHFTEMAECEGTMALSGRGKLVFAGTVPPKRQFVLAVTGGTGELIGRDGQVVVEEGPNVDRFTIFLVK